MANDDFKAGFFPAPKSEDNKGATSQNEESIFGAAGFGDGSAFSSGSWGQPFSQENSSTPFGNAPNNGVGTFSPDDNSLFGGGSGQSAFAAFNFDSSPLFSFSKTETEKENGEAKPAMTFEQAFEDKPKKKEEQKIKSTAQSESAKVSSQQESKKLQMEQAVQKQKPVEASPKKIEKPAAAAQPAPVKAESEESAALHKREEPKEIEETAESEIVMKQAVLEAEAAQAAEFTQVQPQDFETEESLSEEEEETVAEFDDDEDESEEAFEEENASEEEEIREEEEEVSADLKAEIREKELEAERQAQAKAEEETKKEKEKTQEKKAEKEKPLEDFVFDESYAFNSDQYKVDATVGGKPLAEIDFKGANKKLQVALYEKSMTLLKKSTENIDSLCKIVQEKNQKLKDTANIRKVYDAEKRDFENYKKRNAEIAHKAKEDGFIKAVLSMLPPMDTFERAIENIPDEKVREGVIMIQRQFIKALSGLGVEEMKALGEEFNPEFHYAVATAEAEKPEQEDTVVEVMQKGYMLGDKVIRPAYVKVAK